MSRELTGAPRARIAEILETVAREGLGPRDMDWALDAIGRAVYDDEENRPIDDIGAGAAFRETILDAMLERDGLWEVLLALEIVCHEKADIILSERGDGAVARKFARYGDALGTLARKAEKDDI